MRVTVVQRVLPVYRVPFFERLGARLNEEGDRLSLVGGTPGEQEGIVDASSVLGATVVANRALPAAMVWQRRVVGAVRSTRPDIVIMEANPRLLSNLPLVAWCRKAGVPVVAWGVGKVERSRSEPVEHLSNAALRVQLSGCRAALGYGDAAAATFARLGPSRLVVGVAPNATVAVGGEPAPRPERDSSCPTFLFVGRLVEQKRVDVLLKAAATLSADGFDFRLVIAGDGPHASTAKALAHGVPGVELLGRCDAERVHELMRGAHALVLPGRGGLVVQEALASGLPVVVGPPDVAGDGTVHRLLEGSCAAIVAVDATATSFADAMRRAVDCGRWHERSRAAAELAGQHGGIEAMTDAFLDVLRKVR